MARTFRLEVHTPYRLFYAGPVEALVADLADGQIGIYPDRAPCLAPLRTGVLRFRTEDGRWLVAAVSEGILEVTRDGTTVLSGSAEWPEEIDAEKSREAKREAEAQLATAPFAYEARRLRERLARAANRLRVKELAESGGKPA